MQLVKSENKQKLILENKNLYKSILILAFPIFISNLMKAANDFIDMYFISNFTPDSLVESAITAVQVTGPVFWISQAVAGGLMIAGIAIIAQFLGAKQKERATLITGQLLRLSLFGGLLINVLLFFLARPTMVLIGAEGVTLDLMVKYLKIRSFEMLPLFMYYAFHASRQASGDTVTPLILNIIMIIVNIIVTWIFVGILQMGVVGAALGTLISHSIIVPIFMYLMFNSKSDYIKVKLIHLKRNVIEIKKIFQLAYPISISHAFTSFGFIVVNALILGLGENVVSAFGIGNRINQLVLLPAMGIGGVVATFVGQNIGALNIKRARESVKVSMILAILISALGAAIVLPFIRPLSALFLERVPDAMELCIEYSFFLLVGLPFMGIFQVFMGAYQGSGESKFSLIVSTIRLWFIRIPLVLLFIHVYDLGPNSIWYGMLISNVAAVYLGCIFYTFCKFKPKVKIKNEELAT